MSHTYWNWCHKNSLSSYIAAKRHLFWYAHVPLLQQNLMCIFIKSNLSCEVIKQSVQPTALSASLSRIGYESVCTISWNENKRETPRYVCSSFNHRLDVATDQQATSFVGDCSAAVVWAHYKRHQVGLSNNLYLPRKFSKCCPLLAFRSLRFWT